MVDIPGVARLFGERTIQRSEFLGERSQPFYQLSRQDASRVPDLADCPIVRFLQTA